jgi:hypothetical protein
MKNKILVPNSNKVIYKRGLSYTIQGKTLFYSKMVNGDYSFKDEKGAVYHLTKEGVLNKKNNYQMGQVISYFDPKFSAFNGLYVIYEIVKNEMKLHKLSTQGELIKDNSLIGKHSPHITLTKLTYKL